MKSLKTFLAALLLAVLLSGLGGGAWADRADNTYHVRLFGGDMGTIVQNQDADVQYTQTSDSWTYGDYTFDITKINVKDARYYVKGIREAGTDNSKGYYVDKYQNVKRDMDFVVAYGMLGTAVGYKVYFVDGSGKELESPREYYGNIDDKPVVSYVYIEGYQPKAYALTKTLVADESQNVFAFVYTPITGGTTTVVEGGAEWNEGNEGNNPPAPQPPAPETPEELIDLDVPQAKPEGTETSPSPSPSPSATPQGIVIKPGTPVWLLLLILLCLAGVLTVPIVFLLFRKKDKKDKEEEKKED